MQISEGQNRMGSRLMGGESRRYRPRTGLQSAARNVYPTNAQNG